MGRAKLVNPVNIITLHLLVFYYNARCALGKKYVVKQWQTKKWLYSGINQKVIIWKLWIWSRVLLHTPFNINKVKMLASFCPWQASTWQLTSNERGKLISLILQNNNKEETSLIVLFDRYSLFEMPCLVIDIYLSIISLITICF